MSVWIVERPPRFPAGGAALAASNRFGLEDSGKRCPVAEEHNEPKDCHDDSGAEGHLVHQNPYKQDVDDHWADDHQRQGDIAIDEQQNAGNHLAQSYKQDVLRGEKRSHELPGGSRRKWLLRKDVEELVEAKDQED